MGGEECYIIEAGSFGFKGHVMGCEEEGERIALMTLWSSWKRPARALLSKCVTLPNILMPNGVATLFVAFCRNSSSHTCSLCVN